MALVSYDYDSASDEGEEEDIPVTTTGSSTALSQSPENHSVPPPPREIILEDIQTKSTLFSTLPQTKPIVTDIVEDQIEDFIPKSKLIVKDKQKVKITIPSLSEFNDVEDNEPQIKKSKLSDKGSGLISLLPPVRGSVKTTKSFVPNIINKKRNNNSNISATKGNTLVPNAVKKKTAVKKADLLQKMQLKNNQGSDAESDDDIEMPETFDDEMWEKICGRPKSKPAIYKPEEPPQEIINLAPEPEMPYDGLDNKAFKELVGRSKRPIGNIKLIDINEEEILPEKDLWMTKSLTDPEMAPKPNEEDPVDPTRRKKHHITYLAQQAKANEQELQNAWAASKNNRMASRAKYGF